MRHLHRLQFRLLALCAAAAVASAAHAGAVITFGNTSLGVQDTGELNFSGNGPIGAATYGVYRNGVGDAISPGCACEGWGVALSNVAGDRIATFANQSAGSDGFAANGLFGSTANTATSVVGMRDAPVIIRHAYGPSLVADVFQVQVTVTNNGSNTLGNLVYRRAMDWDVPPTAFSEYVTHSGVVQNLVGNGGNLLFASNNGFANSDPRLDAGSIVVPGTFSNPGVEINTVNTDFNKAGVEDHGSVFDFAFGDLAAGESRVFNIYYGTAANEASALQKVAGLGISLYSLGQSSDPANSGEGGGGEGGGEPTADSLRGFSLTATSEAGFNPADAPTFIFGFGGVGGVQPGSTQDFPVLPFVPAPGTFVFDAPVSGRWYDPPFATGFTIEVEGGDMLSITAPLGFKDLKVVIDGVVVEDDLDGGESYTFRAGVRSFDVTGMLVDTAAPAPFPLYMEFESSVTGMTWNAQLAPVPENGTLALTLAGLALMAGVLRRRR